MEIAKTNLGGHFFYLSKNFTEKNIMIISCIDHLKDSEADLNS